MAKGGQSTTTVDVPPEFKPFFTGLFGSSGNASQQAVANQQGVLNGLSQQPSSLFPPGGQFGQQQPTAPQSPGGKGGQPPGNTIQPGGPPTFQAPFQPNLPGGPQTIVGGQQGQLTNPQFLQSRQPQNTGATGSGFGPSSVVGGPGVFAGGQGQLIPGQPGFPAQPPLPTAVGQPQQVPNPAFQQWQQNLERAGDAADDRTSSREVERRFRANNPQPPQFIAGTQAPPGVGGISAPGVGAPPAAGTQGGDSAVGLPFPGPFSAGPNAAELGSIGGQLGLAGQFGGLGNQTLNLGQQQASGAFLNPNSNPFLRGSIQNAIDPQIRAFQEQVLPTFNSAAIQGGAFKGSSARDLAQNQLASSVMDQISKNAFDVASQNFSQERQLQQNAPNLLDAGARLQQLSPALLGQAGQNIRSIDQRAVDEQLLRFQEATQAPFRTLNPLASIIQGGNIGSSTVQTLPQQNPFASGILGALGGGQLGNSAGFGGAGTAVGAGLGGLAGLLGGL